MRRRVPWWVLALLFLVLPIVEIYLLVQLGQVIGAWWTVLIVIAVAVAGSYLIKREGGRAWRALTQALGSGRMPATELADGALILIGGTLLVTPGFVSDVLGIVFILPATRPWARRGLARVLKRRLLSAPRTGTGYAERGPAGGQRPSPGPDVVRGEVIDDS